MMTKLIVQLVCLSVALALSDANKWSTTDPVVKFYCEANDLKMVSIDLLFEHGINVKLSNCCTHNLSNITIQTVIEHFNRTCKTFTAVNAFKYQLQHYLFYDANNETLPEDVRQNLTRVITSLQTMARHLKDIAINEGAVCVKFTPKQYMQLYDSGLLYADNNVLSTGEAVLYSLVESALRTWLFATTFNSAITNAPARPPRPRDCITNINY